jgi:hypothetical protein
MNGTKRLSILGVMTCLGLMVIFGGCKKSSEMTPSAALLQSNGCKEFLANASGPLDKYVYGQYEECLEYQYNGRDTLALRHINAGFNCCPGEITADIKFSGNAITINEMEAEQACDCLCLFDLDYEIINLAPGEYTIRIIEPYIDENDQVLECTLQLLSETSGNYCLQRTDYPWGQ